MSEARARTDDCRLMIGWNRFALSFQSTINNDGLVKSRKINLLPQYIGHGKANSAIYCVQNEKLGLFTSSSTINNQQSKEIIHETNCRSIKAIY